MNWSREGIPANLAPHVRLEGSPGDANRVAVLKIRTILGNPVTLKRTEDSGWMTEGDLDLWQNLVAERDFRKANYRKQGYNAKAQAILQGYSLTEANILATQAHDEARADRFAQDNAVTFRSLKEDALELAIEYNAGETITVVGSMVAMIPGYGTLIGGAMVIGGTALTQAQKNELMKTVAQEKKQELVAARTRFLRGEITKEQYLAIQRQIIEEHGKLLQARYGSDLGFLLVDEPIPADSLPVRQRINRFLDSIRTNPGPAFIGLATGTAGALVAYTLLKPGG